MRANLLVPTIPSANTAVMSAHNAFVMFQITQVIFELISEFFVVIDKSTPFYI